MPGGTRSENPRLAVVAGPCQAQRSARKQWDIRFRHGSWRSTAGQSSPPSCTTMTWDDPWTNIVASIGQADVRPAITDTVEGGKKGVQGSATKLQLLRLTAFANGSTMIF